MFRGTIDKTDGADGELITIDDARCEVIPTAQKGSGIWGEEGERIVAYYQTRHGPRHMERMGIERENVKKRRKKFSMIQ